MTVAISRRTTLVCGARPKSFEALLYGIKTKRDVRRYACLGYEVIIGKFVTGYLYCRGMDSRPVLELTSRIITLQVPGGLGLCDV